MVSQIHLDLQRKWCEILREKYNCIFIAMEHDFVTESGKTYRVDVFGVSVNGHKYIIEIGELDASKFLALKRYAKSPDITFFYKPYTKTQLKLLNSKRTPLPIEEVSLNPFDILRNPEKKKTLMSRSEFLTKLRKYPIVYNAYVRILKDLEEPRAWSNRDELLERKKAIENYFAKDGLELPYVQNVISA